MKKQIVLIFVFVISLNLFAQTNLVPNQNFQKVAKKVKEKGQIAVATPWISPTLAQADLFLKSAKGSEIFVPENVYGSEDPMSGDNYAGIVAYSYKGKNPRSYLQVKLTEPLKAGVEYCVTYHVSLSDLSKYACNYLGAYISIDAVSANNSDVMQFSPQIISRKLKVYEKQFYWTPVCSKFVATGGEQYLTIGNFTPDEKLQLSKIKRPQGFTTPQINDAYYYIDNVSVIPATEVERCDCDFTPGVDDVETLNSTFKSDLSGNQNKVKIIDSYGAPQSDSTQKNTNSANTNIKASVKSGENFHILFDDKKIDLTPETIKKLDETIAFLKSNPSIKVELLGYIDETEKQEDKLDGRRIGAVNKYLISKGIVKENIVKTIKGVSQTKDVAKNRKVEVVFIK